MMNARANWIAGIRILTVLLSMLVSSTAQTAKPSSSPPYLDSTLPVIRDRTSRLSAQLADGQLAIPRRVPEGIFTLLFLREQGGQPPVVGEDGSRSQLAGRVRAGRAG